MEKLMKSIKRNGKIRAQIVRRYAEANAGGASPNKKRETGKPVSLGEFESVKVYLSSN